MLVELANIEMDPTTQCRSFLNPGRLEEYADDMRKGDEFPPIEVYGTVDKCWIADGWHRVLAAREIGCDSIEAEVHHGGRTEAVQHALKANAVHGLRRTNADKRRAVEVALQEFGNQSSRAIAEMCGVGDQLVRHVKEATCVNHAPDTVTGQDGKQYPASKTKSEPEQQTKETDSPPLEHGPDRQEPQWDPERASMAMQYAQMAISQLQRIGNNDVHTEDALRYVIQWIEARISPVIDVDGEADR